jgi:amino acid adenylation domain-containing protein
VSDKNFLAQGFLRSAATFPNRPALQVEGCTLSYSELHARADAIAAALLSFHAGEGPALTAVFAYRSITSFAGILGILLTGHGYVPLNRTFPAERTRWMLEESGCHAMIVDNASARQLESILAGFGRHMLIILPDCEDVSVLAARLPGHRFLSGTDVVKASAAQAPVAGLAQSLAYLLFTSGSTGRPKGVMVTQANVLSYVATMTKRYDLKPEDRCSQMFDTTFDLSAHDMFVTWAAGACLCCPSQKTLINPGQFLRDSKLTVWFSVPSTAAFMKRLGALKPGMYPGLRLSLFCGEALPLEIAQQWALAAPNSVIENIYGPTELTIACTAYRWDSATSPVECEHGIVPIGSPFDTMEALVVDEHLRPVNGCCDGELVMTGPQLSSGYWRDDEKTSRAFIKIPGRRGIYYRTGDRVRLRQDSKTFVYLGRLDNQIKVRGYRVELGEIEAAVRSASGLDGIVAIGWPVTEGAADGVEVFLEADSYDIASLLDRLKRTLPPYMMPRNIRLVSQFPLNSNGKYDRRALQDLLQSKTT